MAFRVGAHVHRAHLLPHRDECAFRVGAGYADEPFRIRVGQGNEQNTVYQAEDGGVGPDSQRKCQNRNRRKARRLAHPSQPVPRILYDVLHPSPSPRISRRFLH